MSRTRQFLRWGLNTFFILALATEMTTTSWAQTTSRITQPIDRSNVVQLAHTTHALTKIAKDQGRVRSDLPMQRMVLVLRRSDTQENALRKLLDSEHDKASGNFHHWLTPEEFGAKFGPSDSDLNQIRNWLSQQGFEVGAIARGKQWVEFSGTAAQVERAFQTEMHRYAFRGEKHVANSRDISIPAALVPTVAGVLSLHDFRKKPTYAKGFVVHRDSVTGKLRPDYTHVTDHGTFHYLAPGDFQKIYNTEPLLNGGFDGTGISIAIPGRSDINLSDVQFFRHIFGLPDNDPVFITDGTSPGVIAGDDTESSLDVEWAGALAPRATIKFVSSANTFSTDGVDLSTSYIVDNAIAPILSVTYGLCEPFLSPAGNAFQNSLFQQAAAEGITAFVASGDNGAAGCDLSIDGPAIEGLQVNGTASTPYSVTVGGTQFNENGAESKYWLTSNRPDLSSAIGYIPEAVWNESCDPTVDPNFCFGTGQFSLAASSGGPSHCTNSTVVYDPYTGSWIITCMGGYAKPDWQAGTGVPNDGARDIPDLSLAAAAAHDGYLICVEGSCQADESSGSVVLTNAFIVGGTSAATPSMAAVMALLEEKAGQFQGLGNYELYQLAAAEKIGGCNSSKLTNPTAASSCIFYDITVGNNSVPGQTGFNATKGYDLSTGWGSVNAANLADAWGTGRKLDSLTSLASQTSTVQHGQPVTLDVAVKAAAGGGTPAGDFSLVTPKGSVFGGTLSGGRFQGTVVDLPGGAYHFTAQYAGNAMFSGSDSNAVGIRVTPEESVTNATLWSILEAEAPTPVDYPVPYGQPLAIQVDTNGKSGVGYPTGSLQLNLDGITNLGKFPLNSHGGLHVDFAGIDVRPGQHVFSASYSGDDSFAPSVAKVRLTESKGLPAITTDAGPTTVTAGNPVEVIMSVGGAGVVAPTGTVVLLDNGKRIAGPFTLGPNGQHFTGLVLAKYKAVLPVGDHLLTTEYSGDANYGKSSFRSFGIDVTVNPATGLSAKVQLKASASSVALGQSLNYVATVQPAIAGGPIPTGTVTLVAQDGLVQAGPIPLVGGIASFSFPFYQGGEYLFAASYSGDSNYGPTNSSNILLTNVSLGMPTAVLTAASSTVRVNIATSLTITVTGNPANKNLSVPSGQVEFFDSVNGGAERRLGMPQYLTLGNGNVGIYTFPIVLPAGHNLIRAKYLGSASASFGASIDWAPATSNPVAVDVN